MDINYYREKLEAAGVVFEPGLNASEIKDAEDLYNFQFPPDLREFLMYALPVSKNWISWRDPENIQIKQAFDWIYEGFYFDIENNFFWLNEWGEKPSELQEAFSIARQKIDEAPKLIPIVGHRYIPTSPHEINNPVFSVYQTDIIYYGSNLWNYLENEFSYYFQKPAYELATPIKNIEFWSPFAEDLV